MRADLQKQRSPLRVEMTQDNFNESQVKSIQAGISKLQNDLSWRHLMYQRAA
jgi:hypothetical protein